MTIIAITTMRTIKTSKFRHDGKNRWKYRPGLRRESDGVKSVTFEWFHPAEQNWCQAFKWLSSVIFCINNTWCLTQTLTICQLYRGVNKSTPGVWYCLLSEMQGNIGSNIRRGATCDRFYDKKKSCTFYGVWLFFSPLSIVSIFVYFEEI